MIRLHYDDSKANDHFEVFKDVVQLRINKILKNGIKRKKKALRINTKLHKYLEALSVDDDKLERILCGRPEELKQIIKVVKRNFPEVKNKNSNANYVLSKIFITYGYDKLRKMEFVKNVKIDTCPYCNRAYIYWIDGKYKIKPQIDHFFPKSKYPFLGLSYYNLIPSCQTCNGFEAKGSRDPLEEGLVNPYDLTDHDFVFSYTLAPSFLDAKYNENNINVVFKKKIDGHLKVFKLKDLYEKHADHVMDLIIKSKLTYTKRYREYLRSYFNSPSNQFAFNEGEIDRLILGNYSNKDDVHKRPLAKLYQDIGRELRLIPK